MIGSAVTRITWQLDVIDRGAGKKMLAQDRQIRRSLQANDAAYKKTATSASASANQQTAASSKLVAARSNETRATRGTATAVQQLSAAQAKALQLGSRVSVSANTTAQAYDRQTAAARRAAAAERARGGAMKSTAGTIGRMARTGGLGGALGLGLAIGQTVKFDRAMRNVNSIAQLGEKRFQALSTSVRGLGGKTAQSPQTLAEGLYDLVSSGFNARQSMRILEKSARAATAGLTTTEVSTKAVAAVLNAYQLPASKAGLVSDQLFRTVDRGVISFEELASTVGDVLPFASSLGVGLDEVGASVATMTKAGIKAPETMTRIKAAMVGFLKPSEALSDALKTTGYESGEALIKAKGFQGGLDAVIGTTDGTKQAVAELFPNIRGMGALLALTGENSKKAGEDLKGMGNAAGATNRALSQQSKSVALQWDRLKAKASDLTIQVGSRMIPKFREFLKVLTDERLSGGEKFDRITSMLSDAVSKAIPKAAEAAARAAPAVASAFVRGFSNAGVWGKVAIGTFLFAKMGGFRAARGLGGVIAGGVASGMAGGAAGGAVAGGAAGGGVLGGMLAKGGRLAKFARVGAIGIGLMVADQMISSMGDRMRSRADDPFEALEGKAKGGGNIIAKGLAAIGGDDDQVKNAKELREAIRGIAEEGKRISPARADELREALSNVGDITKSARREIEKLIDVGVNRSKRIGLIANEFGRLRSGAVIDVKEMRQTVSSNLKAIQNELGLRSRKGRDYVRENFQSAAGWIKTYMSDGKGLTGGGMRAMERLMRTHSKLGADALKGNYGSIISTVHSVMRRGGKVTEEGLRIIRDLLAQELRAYDFTRTQARHEVMPGRRYDAGPEEGSRGPRGGRRGGIVPFRHGGRAPSALAEPQVVGGNGGMFGGVLQGALNKATAAANRGLGFRGGGMTESVPSLVSSGELLRFPNGSWASVPGERVAADNVFMALPPRTEVFTDDGQMLLAQGASRTAALSQQMPHFQKGGRTSYSAGRLAGLARWAGLPRSAAVVAGATAKGESGGNRRARNLSSIEDSRGLWQVNVRAHPWARAWDLYDEETNAKAMRRISGGGKNFRPWTVFTSGAYRAHLGSARKLLPWSSRTKGRGGSWETYKGKPRPAGDPIPSGRLDRWTRRRLLAGLSGDAFGTGYGAGQAGYRALINVPGVGDLIGGSRVAMERPDRKRYKGSKRSSAAGSGGPDAIVAAASRINRAGYAYHWGGGHGVSPIRPTMGIPGGPHRGPNPGYDCSGAIGRLLQEAGVPGAPKTALHSSGYGNVFRRGRGKRFTIHSTPTHVWATIGGRGWGTSSSNPRGGPGWHAPRSGGVMTHPAGMRRGGIVGYRSASEIPAYERAMPFRDVYQGILPGLRAGGRVQSFKGGGRSGIFNVSPLQNLRIDVAQIQDLASGANHAATRFMSQLAEALDNARTVTYRALVKLRASTRGSIRELIKGGVTRREGAQIQRLRATIDLVEAEMGRRTGLLVRHQQRLVRVLEGRRSRLEHRLRRAGVDEASLAGVEALLQVEETAARNLKKQRKDLRAALRQARKAGDRDAVAEIREGMREVNAALRENTTRQLELQREAIVAAAQGHADHADFTAQWGQGMLANLDATQRLNRTADTAGGMRQRATAMQGMVPLLEAQQAAQIGQAQAAWQAGDAAGFRAAMLAAQQSAADIATAMADAADLIREAAQKEAQDRVDATQFQVDVAQSWIAGLDVTQRMNRTADTAAGMRERAALIQQQLVPHLQANQQALYNQMQVAASTEGMSSPEFRSAFLAVENAGNEIATAMADAADLLRDASMRASQDLVDAAQHGTAMGNLQVQRLELEQRLAGTADTTHGRLQIRDLIMGTILPAIDAEIAALREKERVAREQGDEALLRELAEQIAAKDNEKLQAQLDALEAIKENTESLKEFGGSTAYDFAGQRFTDLSTVGGGL